MPAEPVAHIRVVFRMGISPIPASRLRSAVWPGFSSFSRLNPAIQLMLDPAESLASAEAAARRLAHSHYENFSVVSRLLPRNLRQDFCNVYAFCRVADDLGDELGDTAVSLEQLACLREKT